MHVGICMRLPVVWTCVGVCGHVWTCVMVCGSRFQKLHSFYDRLCPECADLNFQKRNQTADLRGYVAIVTGGRVKIGASTGCDDSTLRCTGPIVIDCVLTSPRYCWVY